MNTRDRRASALGCGLAFLVSLPLPDAALNQGDRQHAVALYRGILAGAPVAPVEINLCDAETVSLVPVRRTRSRVPDRETSSLVPVRRTRKHCP